MARGRLTAIFFGDFWARAVPLANDAHAYWSGYFTSRPALKRQVRFASNFLNAARQMEIVSGVTAEMVNTPTTRPSPPVGSSWTDSMEGAIGVATHHDGMSGTERQDVSNDYAQRISEGHFEVEAGVAMSLQKLAGITDEIGHCNCNAAGNCLNMSVCAYTTGVDEFTVLAWNPQGRNTSSWLRIPVSGAQWTVTDLASGTGLPSQATALDARTMSLPLLYINNFGKDPEAKAAEVCRIGGRGGGRAAADAGHTGPFLTGHAQPGRRALEQGDPRRHLRGAAPARRLLQLPARQERGQEGARGRGGGGPGTSSSVALSLCTTAHLLPTRFTNIFGASISEATMRPNPRPRRRRPS
jgi:hypothetical protein